MLYFISVQSSGIGLLSGSLKLVSNSRCCCGVFAMVRHVLLSIIQKVGTGQDTFMVT